MNPGYAAAGARRFQPMSSLWLIVLSFCMAIGAGTARADDWIYTAQEGDTLWDLADRYTRSLDYWPRLQALNHISEPRRIPPGTRIRIPVDWLKFEPAPVRVIQVQGDSTFVPAAGGTGPQALHDGDILHSGDRVHTGADASVSLRFADGSVMLVRPNTDLTLDSLSVFSEGMMVDSRLRLERGAVDNHVVPQPEGIAPRFRINTPAAVAAVRGTDFRVIAEETADGDDTMRNETLEGVVAVAGSRGQRLAPAGFGVRTDAGAAPTRPRELREAPDLSALPDKVEELPVRVTWQRRDGDASFRVQLAPDARFEKLLADQLGSLAAADFGDLPDGTYALRIRAVDGEAFEGYDAVHSFEVDARPEPPVPMKPEDNGRVYKPRPNFVWSKPEGAARYHFQLARTDDFARPIVDNRQLTDTEFELDKDLALGHYVWHIATIDQKGDHGPFSLTIPFDVKAPPAAPEAPEAGISDEALHFKWKKVADATQYQFQMAEDKAFTEMALDRKLPSNELTVKPDEIESGGTHYFRIRGLNADGAEGPWGTIQEIDLPSKHSPLWFLVLTLVLIPILL